MPVIDADELAREVVGPGSEGLREVAVAFGERVILPDGTLDRPALAAIVFSDTTARRRLEAITHPRIADQMAKRAEEFARAGQPIACYEAALIVENGAQDRFRPLVVVACPEEVQLARIRKRDTASQQDALARVRAQKPLSEKVAVADFVIDTAGSLEASARRTDEVLRAICTRLQVDEGRYFAPGKKPGSA
jgi:dephospho-CoA kinase